MNHTKIMIKKNSLTLFVCILFAAISFNASAQKGKTTSPAKPAAPAKTSSFKIKGKIEGLRDTALYLGNYYGKSLYYNDTCRVDANGNFEFDGKKADEIGKYAIIMPGPKYFDIIVDQENIVINASSDNDISKVVVKESENNKLFFEYIRYINAKRSSREPIDKVLNDSTKTDEEKKPFQEELKVLNDSNEILSLSA